MQSYKHEKTKFVFPGAAVISAETISAQGISASFIPFETVSGITSVNAASNANGASYNLQGQKVGSSYKGIIVKNGHKYVK